MPTSPSRVNLVPGNYTPNTTNTGVPSDVVLVRRDGNVSITADGTVFEGFDVYGKISVSAQNVTIRNCRVRGNQFSNVRKAKDSSFGLITCTSANVKNLLIEDTHIQPDFPSNDANGVLGHDFTLSRCLLRHCSDMMGTFNTSDVDGPVAVNILANYGVDNVFWRPSDIGTRPEGTHNDCIQISGGSGYRIIGNSFGGRWSTTIGETSLANPEHKGQSTAVIIITPNVGKVADVLIDKNWLRGGQVQINVSQKTKGPIPGIRITNNKFDRSNRHTPTVAFIEAPSYDLAYISNNVFEDGITPLPKLTRVVI